jgi:hypothetical protein
MHYLGGKALEARLERAVDDEIARAHDRAADQARVDVTVQAHFTLQTSLQPQPQLFAL